MSECFGGTSWLQTEAKAERIGPFHKRVDTKVSDCRFPLLNLLPGPVEPIGHFLQGEALSKPRVRQHLK